MPNESRNAVVRSSSLEDAAVEAGGMVCTEPWDVVPLESIFSPIPKRDRQVRIEDDESYRLLTVRLYAKGLVLRGVERGERIGTKTLFRTECGDFVFSKIDARNGAWGFVPPALAGGMVSGDFPILQLDLERADPEFVEYALSRPATWRPLRDIAVGTTNRRRIQVAEFLKIEIPLPPPPEQRAIAHVLRTVQRAKEATEAVIAATRELKKSLMWHLFTYGPVPVDQADQVPLQETNHGDVPAAWEIRSLREIAHVQTGVAKGRKIKDAHTVEVPYLRVANVQDGYIDLSEIKTIRLSPREIGRYQLQAGDIVLTEGGDFDKLGRGFVWDGRIPGMVHQNHVFAVRADQRVILPHYLGYLIQSSYAKSYFLTVAHRTTNLASINSTKLGDFPVPVPTLAEQQRIVDVLRVVDHEIRVESGKFAALDALFSSLLYHLMTGKVRVGDAILADVTSGFPGVSILADP